MGSKTKIDWCDSTWNPVTGCLHGCEHCGTQYSDKAEAQRCEKNHKKPKEIRKCRYPAIGNDASGYPSTIIVTFEDGSECQFRR